MSAERPDAPANGTDAGPDERSATDELDAALGGGIEELPPNVPPGFLGESGLDLYKVDGDEPHGLNAGIIQEWTWETTMLLVLLSYVLLFPLAFVILWRSSKVSRNQKIVFSLFMAIGIVLVAVQLIAR